MTVRQELSFKLIVATYFGHTLLPQTPDHITLSLHEAGTSHAHNIWSCPFTREFLRNPALAPFCPTSTPSLDIIESTAPTPSMCYYHAYSHRCGHTECILQKLCPKGQMIQQKCGRGYEEIIMATVKLETTCESCKKACPPPSCFLTTS
jgi:hypothetical protein